MGFITDLIDEAGGEDAVLKLNTPAAPSAADASTAEREPGDNLGQFIDTYLPAAQRKAKELGVSPISILAQAALETGNGKSIIPGTHNLFNIKDFSGSGVEATDNMTGSRDKYRAYETPDAAFDDHAGLLSRRYKGALNTGDDVSAYFGALKTGGYAEDPDYVLKGVKMADAIRARVGDISSQTNDQRIDPERLITSDYEAPVKEEGMGEAFVRNAKKTLPQTKQLLSGAGALAADTLGLDGARDYLMESYREGEKATEHLTRPTDSWSEGGKDSLGNFIAGSAGYFTGQILESAALAVAAGTVGSAAGGAGAVPAALGSILLKTEAKEAIHLAADTLIKAELKKQIEKGVAKEVAEKAAEKVGADFAKTMIAKTAGKEAAIGGVMVGQGVGMETGEIYGHLAEQARKEGREVTDEERGRAWLYGGIAGTFEGIVDKYNLDAIIGGGAKGTEIKQRLMGILRGAAKAEAREVPTETVQTGLERAGKGQDWSPSDPDAAKEYVDTAAMTAAGAWIPGVGGARVDTQANAPKPERKPDSPLTNAANAGRAAATPAMPGNASPDVAETNFGDTSADSFAEKTGNATQDKVAAIAARDEINQKIAGVQSLLERTTPGSEEETTLRNTLQSHLAARDEAIRRIEILNTFDAPAEKRGDAVAGSDASFARILSAADRFAQDRDALAGLSAQERETALRHYAVLRNPTLDETVRRDSANALLNVFDAVAGRRSDAAELRQFVNAERAELEQLRKSPPKSNGTPPNDTPPSPPGGGGGGGGGVSPTQGPTPGFGAMTEFEKFLSEERNELSGLRQRADAERQSQKEGRLQDIGATIDGNRALQTAESRRRILDDVLADPAIKDHAKAYRAALIRAGRNDYDTLTPEESERIARFSEINGTFPQESAPSIEPSAPNEMPADLVREKGSRAGDRAVANPRYTEKAAKIKAKYAAQVSTPVSVVDEAPKVEPVSADESTPAPAPAPKKKAGRAVNRSINTETDSLFMAISKLGGVKTDDIVAGWGHDPKDFKNGRMMGFGLRVSTKSGESVDGMLEALKQYGYFDQDATLADFEAKFRDELGGSLHMTPEGHMQGAERAAEAQHIAEQEAAEITAGTGVESLATDVAEEIEHAAEVLSDFDLPFEEEIDSSHAAEIAGMRAMGFTEQEIQDEIGRSTQGNQRQDSVDLAQGSAGATDEGAAGHANDGFALAQAADGQADQVTPDDEGITKEQADKERDAVPFSLATQSQPKPVGVQSGMFTADGRVAQAAKVEPAPAVSDIDALKAEMGQAIGELASILGVKTNMTPEEEVRILPVMSKIFRIAAKMGYITFKDAAVHVVKQLRELGGKELADKISIDNLQSGYINIAKEIGGDKKQALEFESLDELMAGHDELVESIAAAEQTTDHNPSLAQIDAENYRTGKFDWNGLTISVETAKGQERRDKETNGEKWRVTMPATYGRILGTVGADKDHVDVFVGDHPESNKVFIIDQNKVDSKTFDEHKVMIGYRSAEDAHVDYLLSFSDMFAPRVFGQISEAVTPEQLKEVMPSLAKKKPFTTPEHVVKAQSLKEGQYVEIKHTDGNTIKGVVVMALSTSGGNIRYDIRTGKSNLDGYPTETRVYSQNIDSIGVQREATPDEINGNLSAQTDPVIQPVAEPKGWRTSWGTASKYAEALGLSTRNDAGKSMKLPELVAAIDAHLSGQTPESESPAANESKENVEAVDVSGLDRRIAETQARIDSMRKLQEQAKANGNAWVYETKIADAEKTKAAYEKARASVLENAQGDDKPKARRPIPGDADYTLELAREDLDAMHQNTGERWFAQDDRLTDRIKRQENLIKEMEAESAATSEDESGELSAVGSKLVRDPYGAYHEVTMSDGSVVRMGKSDPASDGGLGAWHIDLDLTHDTHKVPGPSRIGYISDVLGYTKEEALSNIGKVLQSFEKYRKQDNKLSLDNQNIPQDAGIKESGDEQTGNGGNGQESLAPVSPGIVQGTEGQRDSGQGSGSLRGTDAAGNGRSDEDARDDQHGSVDGEPESLLSERPAEVVEISGETRPLEEVAENVKHDAPASEPKGAALTGNNPGNYVITDDDRVGHGTPGERIRNNLAAVRLVLDLEREQRYATPEEQAVLVKYVGWGGLKNVFKPNSDSKQEREAFAELKKLLTEQQLFWMGQSVLDAHYTSPKIIRTMYKVLRHFGITGGRFLEPTVGSGNFIGLMPSDMAASAKWFASEIDPITSLIAKHAYPEAQVLTSTGFQEAEFAYGRFDVAIGNPPFGDQRITDNNPKRAEINGQKIHNYIISKSGMHLRPGGVMAMVVTSRFLDTANPEAREFLAKSFRFLGAIRLPNNAFKDNAGTEVTTDLIFMQKLRDGETGGDLGWLDNTGRMLNEDGETVTLNRYFAEHPYRMMGKPSMQGTMYGSRTEKGEFTLQPIEGLDVEAKIDELLSGAWEDMRGIAKKTTKDADVQAAEIMLNREDVPTGGFFRDGERILERMDDDEQGNAQFRELTPETPWTAKQTLGKKKYARIKGILALRDDAYALMAAERADAPAERLDAMRAALNTSYDAFVAEHGFLNSAENVRLFSDDARIEFGLESNYRKPVSEAVAKKTGHAAAPESAVKSALLVERVFYPAVGIEHADTPRDGYSVSLSQRGKLDLDYIAELTNLSRDEVIADLSSGETPLIYKDPESGTWVQEDEYLSGNVKAKLREAMAAGIESNVRALKAVQPADVPAGEVHPEFGATWIPGSIYEEFLRMLGYSSAKVQTLQKSGQVIVGSVGNKIPSPLAADLGNPDFSTDAIFTHVANRRPMIAYDPIGEGERAVNVERTENLKRIARKMIAIWGDWIKADDARADLLAKEYNDKMNTTIERKFDGVTHLRTVGANPTIQLRNSQKNSAWRMIQSPVILMDHVVGAGKTIALITGLMERHRLGLSRKPMVVVPNHLVGQWSRDWMQLYPGANILAATEKDFSKQNRRRLFARIATGNYDAVIVGHSSFGHIPVEKEAEIDFMMAEVKHLQAALEEAEKAAQESGKKENRTVRAIKNRIAKRLEKIKELQSKPRDNVATFEDMGIDYVAVDESHEFKNLEYSTTLSNIAGMGSPEGSKKAFDLYMKTQLITQRNGGIAFATGTPLSNSMVEMYTILRYLNRGALEDRNLTQFDAWAKTFASIESRDEYTAAGKIKARTVMAAFNNLPELLQIYKQVADTVTMRDLKRIYAEQMRAENAAKGTQKSEDFPVPNVKGGGRRLDIDEPTALQVEFMDYLMSRADVMDKLKGKDKQEYAKIDNALWLMNDARKMGLDVRTTDPTAPDEPGNKVNRAAKNIKDIYDRTDKDSGTQLVFCDLSTPAKVADKQARDFIKSALKVLKLEDDKAMQLALEDKTYEVKWSMLAGRADQMLDSDTLKDEHREAIEAFIEKVTDEDMGSLITADSGFSVYDALKEKLIESGIPAREIAFIHDAGTADKKRELFDLVNAGKVRVLIGSSPKMGAGTNAQERVVALHHMDAPWRPSDMEQREGRVIRQGNKLYMRDPKGFYVEIIAYSTERTFDAQMWAVLARKAGFLEQFRMGLRSIKEDGGDAAGYAEFMAEATGNPIFREKIVLEREIDDLEAEDRSAKMKLDAARRAIETADARRAGYRENIAKLEPVANSPIESVTFEGKTYANDLAAVLEAEQEMFRSEVEQYEVVRAEYEVARAEWVAKGTGSDRGRAPSVPAQPEYPETTAARVRAKSEWAKLIGELVMRMSVVEQSGARRFSLTTQDGHTIKLEASPGRFEKEIELTIDDVGFVGNGAPLGSKIPRLLRANHLRAAFQNELSGVERSLSSLESSVAQAKLTIDRIKPVDPERIAAARARYDEVVKEVDALAAQMAAERAEKDNRYITKDKIRFPNGIEKPESGTPSVLRKSKRSHAVEFPGGIDAPTADALVTRLIESLGATASHQTVQSFFDLPAEVQAQARAQKSDEHNTKGVLHNGTIYIVANNAKSIKDIQETVFHELIGHVGMRKLLGPEFVQKTNALFMQLGGLDGLSKIAAENDFGPIFADYVRDIAAARQSTPEKFTKAICSFILTEEVFAHMAEKQPTIYQKAKALIGWVRDWLRRHGFAQLAEYGETDVLHLLHGARAALRGPNGSGPKGGVTPAVMSRDLHTLVGDEYDKGLEFASEFLNELSYEDAAFRYPVSTSLTLEGNLAAAYPGVEYLGEDTRPDEFGESKADRRFVFALPDGKLFYVYERGNEVWIDVSRLLPGDRGGAVYHGVANYAYNTGMVFAGDPNGLSEDAIVRRTSAMLSSALRFGTTAHLDASKEQIKGMAEKGIEPLDWQGNDVAKTKALLHTYLTTLHNQYPGIKNARYDFTKQQFVDRNGLPIRRGDGAGTFVAAGNSPQGRAARAGEASLRRGVLIQSLASSESGERPGILELVLSRSAQLVSTEDSLAAVFRRGPVESFTDYVTTPEGRKSITESIASIFSKSDVKTFNWFHRHIGTQFHKAKIDRDFGRVFDKAQSFIDDVARFGAESADMAPGILPKMDTIGGAIREALHYKRDKEDAKAIAAPIFEGTLFEDEEGNTGKVWTDSELRTRFALNERQVGLYRQFRRAVDHSLEALGVAEMNKTAKVNELEMPDAEMDIRELSDFYAAQFGNTLRDLKDKLEQLKQDATGDNEALWQNAVKLGKGREAYHEALMKKKADEEAQQNSLMKEIETYQAMWDGIVGKKNTILKLQREGYAPLMRFGEFTVDVVEQVPALDKDGKPVIDKVTGEVKMKDNRLFFGMFETEKAAKDAAAALAEEYPQATVTNGVASQEGHQLFGAVSQDSLEMVARLAGKEDEAVQKFYKEAVSSRSALKRLIHRQGIDGYSEDVTRTLASFVLSNARATASAKHFGDLIEAAADIPKEKGDVKDEAVRLINYIRNPNEEAGALRGLLFMQFLGGSVASAAVNLTQTITTTMPYLAQFGANPGDLFSAAKLARKRFGNVETTGDATLDAALTRAEAEGVVSPHNVHALMGETRAQGAMRHRGIRLMSHMWGSFFSMAEQFNRETAFIAAFQQAEKMGPSGRLAAYEKQSKLNQSRGLPAPDWKLFANSFEFAKNAVNETQFVLSKAARPNWARGAVGATLFTFKQFAVFYLELMKRLPNRERALMLGTLILLAGVGGAPGADDLDDLIDTLGQAFGYDTNSARTKREFLETVFGKAGGEFVLNGVSAFLPLDLSNRLGMGNLVPASGGLKKSGSDNRDRDMLELLGPAGGYYKQLTDAWDYTLQGRYGMAITQGLAPKAIKDAAKGISMYQSGTYDDTRGRRVTDASTLDALIKALGFQPIDVAKVQARKGEMMQDLALVRAVKSSLAEIWAQGVHDKDTEKSKNAQAMIEEWNRKNPNAKIDVKKSQVLRRANEMSKSATERFIKAAPKDMRARVSEALATAE